MPRRLDPKACGCGCGQITKSGEFMRGHHTKRRWELVKAAATHVETHNVTRLRTGENVNSQLAYGELARRGWIIPDTYRHFGVELEIVARNDAQVNDVLRSLNVNFSTGGYHARGGAGQWMVTRDSSLRATDAQRGRGLTQCFEVVAPPLRGRKGLALLRRVVTALENAGVEVNKTCGTHVHHDARDFDLDTFKRLTANYARLQNAVDRVLAPSRRSTVGNQYCKPWTAAEIAQMNRANDVRSLTYVGDRYHVLNLNAYASYGTVEFRQHQGTVNADKIVNWVLFTQGMVRAAKKGIEILTTDSLARVAADLGMKTETVEYFTRRANEFAAA